MDLLIYLLVGICAGVLSGLLGLGGGLIFVPALTFAFTSQGLSEQHIMHLATATSLATMILTTLMATWSHHKRGGVQWSLIKLLIPGLMGGAWLGVWIADQLTTQGLRYAFAFFALILGVKMILGANKENVSAVQASHAMVLLLCATGIGILAGILGLGGGIMLVPLLLWAGLPMPKASATSAACAFPTALTGTLTAVIVGWHTPGLPTMTWGYVYWPVALILGVASLLGAPLGVYLAYRLSVRVIKRIFGGILLLIALRMLPSPLF